MGSNDLTRRNEWDAVLTVILQTPVTLSRKNTLLGELRNKVKLVSDNAYNYGIVKAITPPSIVAGSILLVCNYYNIDIEKKHYIIRKKNM